MALPISSSSLLANPTIDANPSRFSHHDGNDINRVVHQLRFFLPWRRINGQFLDIRGHDAGAPLTASFYNHDLGTTQTLPEIPATFYQFANPDEVPSQRFDLKEINARFDSRNFSQQILSREFNQNAFQKQALKLAICSQLEFGLINGNSESNPAQFDGFHRLVEREVGQVLEADTNDGLNIFNRAMARVRSHNRKTSLIVMNQRAWVKTLELQRQSGFAPVFKPNRNLKQRILHIDGIPVCLSDHIATTNNRASVFLLSFGKNGVYGLLSRSKPGIFFSRTSQANSPFIAYQAQLYCGLASTTSDALVEITNWNVNLDDN